ncbi:MAG: ATP-binding protein [Oscillospiraceae bacterium]|nr:ATP-binding protein [Oscillospiraceae bacterium]
MTMKAIDLIELQNRLESLTVFRALLSDKVISSLLEFIAHPCNSSYCEFVSNLYNYGFGNLTDYVKSLCDSSDNIVVRLIGQGKCVPDYMKKSLVTELETLQLLCAVKPCDLQQYIQNCEFLPDFESAEFELYDYYNHKLDNIGRYGYGIYSQNTMFCVADDASLVPVEHPDPIRLSDLFGYDLQKKQIIDNTKALLSGKSAANVLLSGDAGTGKSSTVKAVCNELSGSGLRIVEVYKHQLALIPRVISELSSNPLKFIIFIDDISFSTDDDSFNALKAVLEGSVCAKSDNVVIYATSNRRHIIKEKFSDRDGDDIHRNDTMQEQISLSERFGLHVSFHKPDKADYLTIVTKLAEKNGLNIEKSELENGAERLALQRGGRSPRLALHYINSLLSAD